MNFLPEGDNEETSGMASSPVSSTGRISLGKTSCDPLTADSQKPRKASSLQTMKQLKATKTLAIVVGVFIISWLPFFVIFLAFQYCKLCFKTADIPEWLKTAILIVFVHVLPVSNSAANPIIYTCFNNEFRTAFWRVLYRLSGRRNSKNRANNTNGISEATYLT